MANLDPSTFNDVLSPVVLGADTSPEWGDKGIRIRKMHLRYPELSRAEIARKVGCDPARVTQVLNRFLNDNGEEDLRGFQSNQADIYDAIRLRALSSLTDDKMAKSSASQLAILIGIMHDKAALCRGQATSHVAVVLLDVAAMMRRQLDGDE